jgi:hypothetical protein
MLKAITHYEQVPLGLVVEILARNEQRKQSGQSRGEYEPNLLHLPAVPATSKEGDRD